MQIDPIGFKGGDVNWYAYVRNNSITKFDPFGLQYPFGNIFTPVNVAGEDINPINREVTTLMRQVDQVNYRVLTWGKILDMVVDWVTGTGPTYRIFDVNDSQTRDMMDAPGIKRAIEYFCNKNADIIAANNARCGSQQLLEPLTQYDPGFLPWRAGFDATE